jgi:MerR family copper efflux transcriptional regulator
MDVRRSELMQIGQLAERVGLSLRTIRFYEEAGLVTPVTRTDGGFRLYGDAQVARFEVIKRMKPLGFTVEEMGELLTLLDDVAADPSPQRLDRLRMFHEAAQARVAALREQVEIAEGFAQTLAERLA